VRKYEGKFLSVQDDEEAGQMIIIIYERVYTRPTIVLIRPPISVQSRVMKIERNVAAYSCHCCEYCRTEIEFNVATFSGPGCHSATKIEFNVAGCSCPSCDS
jgi:hypothetical protein